jgi:hypothetical protein
MECRQGCTQPRGPTGEQYVLGAWEDRLKLSLSPPLPTRNEEVDRCFVQMLRQMESRCHVASQAIGEIFAFSPLDGRPDVSLEDRSISIRDPASLLGIVDRNENPRLTIAAAGRERARLADLANQGARDRIGPQSANCAGRANSFEKGKILANALDVDFLHGAPFVPEALEAIS